MGKSYKKAWVVYDEYEGEKARRQWKRANNRIFRRKLNQVLGIVRTEDESLDLSLTPSYKKEKYVNCRRPYWSRFPISEKDYHENPIMGSSCDGSWIIFHWIRATFVGKKKGGFDLMWK